MLIKLIKKEFALCFHPTAGIFLLFSAFVFIPNYPYEVMFFFSGLSAYFICLTARENGDAAFTCTLPVEKGAVARARVWLCVILQAAMLALAALFTAVKEACFAEELLINQAGMMANLAFLGGGCAVLALFDLLFFPLYWRDPNKIGLPFLIAAGAQFVLITLLLVCRHAVPFVRDVLNTPDPHAIVVKCGILAAGLCVFLGSAALSAYLSARRFVRCDV